MGVKQRLLSRLVGASSDQTWAQYIDMLCAMMGITHREIRIDSARAVVHIRYTQLGRQHLVDVPFNEILAAVNGPAKPAQAACVTTPGTARTLSRTPATSPP